MGVTAMPQAKSVLGVSIPVLFVLIAATLLIRTYWPAKQAKLTMTYFTDDDGKTWFADSVLNIPPFDHNGKEAVFAEVYSYDGGSKQFCGYVAKYSPDAKKRLQSALDDAQKHGASPDSVWLFHDPTFMRQGTLVKAAGADGPWLPISDPQSSSVTGVHSPDGSILDQVFVY
jgi:hypothetical protein